MSFLCRPEKDANGNYPIFEIISTNKDAYIVDSFPGDMMGQIGEFSGKFKNGSVTYRPTFFFDKPLSMLTKNAVYTFNLDVYNADNEHIFSVEKINFTFVNKQLTAKPTASKVIVDGKDTAFEAYNIADSNYFKLRDLAKVLSGTDKQFEVGFDSENNAIDLTTGEAYTSNGTELVVSATLKDKPALPSPSKIYIDGEEVNMTAYNIDGNNYFKLRDIAEAIDFGVTYDGKLKMLGIDSTAAYTN